MTTTPARMIQRRRTVAQWASENPVLAAGEIGVATGGAVPVVKIGDGATAWNSLADLVGPTLASSDPAKASLSTVGDVTTLGVEKLAPEYARKTSDQIVNNSAAVVDATGLLVPLAASATYWLTIITIMTSTTAADFTIGWTVPSGATGSWFGGGGSSAFGAATSDSTARFQHRDFTQTGVIGSGDQKIVAHGWGLIHTSTTAGNLQYRFAQAVATAVDTTLHTNSALRAERVA